MKVREIMKPAPITVTESTPLGEAAKTMMEHQIRHLPVVRGQRLCGILSERDVLHYRAASMAGHDWWLAPVTSAMIVGVQTAAPDDSLTEVAGRMANGRIGALPIVERGTLLGLITVTDVLEAEVREAMA